MPAPLKDPAIRRRTNKAATRATLNALGRVRVPPVPQVPKDKPWHELAVRFWRDLWRSPMGPEFVKMDIHGLYRLFVLVDAFWKGPDVKLAAEIAREQQAYGLTPLDRRRLEWTIEKAEQTKKTKRPIQTDDPRDYLQAVK